MLDTQFVTPHLAQFGAAEIPRDDYKAQLGVAIEASARWLLAVDPEVLRAEIKLFGDGR